MTLKHTFVGHKTQINAIDLALKTYYLASGSKDGIVMTWNIQNGTFLGKIDCDCEVNAVKFSPNKYWLFVGTAEGIQVWDLPNQKKIKDIRASPIDAQHKSQKKSIACTSLAWDASGHTLFAGFSDGYVRVFQQTQK